MIQLSFVIVPSRPNSDGTHQIRLKISVNRTTRYISTKYRVANEKQFRNGSVVKHPQAFAINQALKTMMEGYEKKLEKFTERNATATEVKNYLESDYLVTDLMSDYAGHYIAAHKNNGQESYAQNMEYTLRQLLDCFGETLTLPSINTNAIKMWEKYLVKKGYSSTTINIRMSHLKALLNAASAEGVVQYSNPPFQGYRMPAKNVRDICISKTELEKLRNAEFTGTSARRNTVARDLFMLSFYCAGINLTDLIDANFDGDVLTFIRKKTAERKRGADKAVSMTIQPEARAIINKYINDHGKLVLGYNYKDYGQFRSYITKTLNGIGKELGFEKTLMFYSARKTFVQFGADLGIPLYILEYAIGQTIKDKSNRPIHDYFKVMRPQSDMAIRTIINYSMDMEEMDTPIPEWARRYFKNDNVEQ